MKLLGIIGGMSTASSISYYQKINEQINRLLGANHGARLVIYNLDFEEIAQLQKQGNWQQAGEMLADAAKRLVLAGVDGILLATNTMHKVERVFCLSERDEFVWRSGECGRQLAETFGWPGWHSD